jgi:hypothetical protein
MGIAWGMEASSLGGFFEAPFSPVRKSPLSISCPNLREADLLTLRREWS